MEPSSRSDPDAASTGPLEGTKVVELGQLLAGPFCASVLGDLGASVVKVEHPEHGDPLRVWGRSSVNGEHLWFPIVARNKRSVTANLHDPRGQELVRRLAARADVLVENFRPGTLERFGLGYETLSEANPGLVLVRVSGYGQTGPYASRPGYGSIGEAMGGIRYVTGDPDRPPSRVGISLGDALAGLFGALGALAALRERDRSSQGQVVDVAIYEAVLALMESLLPEWALCGSVRERTGAVLPNVAPSNVYPTADGGLILIAANQDTVFRRLALAMEDPELATDERFSNHLARGANQDLLDRLIAKWTASLETGALAARLEAHEVPFGFIYRAAEMLSDPHFRAREAIVEVDHPLIGRFPMQNVAPKLSRTPGRVRWPGPALGEHNDEVWGRWLELSPDELATLRAAKVI
jgi:formyl-CoA transferase